MAFLLTAVIPMPLLTIIDASGAERSHRLSDDVSIGRGQDNAIILADTKVSRNHAQIRRASGHCTLTDLGSSNGSYLNRVRLHPHVPRQLYDNDEIAIGTTRMIYRSEGLEPGPGRIRGSAGITAPAGPSHLGLSVVMTAEGLERPLVSATMDAAAGSLEVSAEDSASIERLRGVVRRFQAMVQVSSALGATMHTGVLLDKIMSSIFDMFPHAERAFVLLRNRETGEMVPQCGRRRSADGPQSAEEFPISRTIVNTVVDKRQSILSKDAQSDDRFKEQRSVVDLSIRSLMVVTFICQDEILGVISVDTMSVGHAFSSDDLAMLTGIAAQAAIAIKNVELYASVEKETRTRAHLSRYLSPDVVERVLDGTFPLHLGGERKRGTVLFCDIVGFTGIAESLTPEQVIDHLNRIYAVITKIIAECNGTLHKFEGDMVMAFWNVLYDDPAAEINALAAGVRMQAAMWLANLAFERELHRPLHIGIGCNTGEFAGGNIGGADHMEYTIIGDQVNLGKRIESLAGHWQIFAAEETWRAAAAQCMAIRLPSAIVKGRSTPTALCSVRGVALPDGTCFLAIPATILTPDGQAAGSGMMVSLEAHESSPRLHLVSGADLSAWESLTLQLDVPELAAAPHLTGRVVAHQRIRHTDHADYSAIELGDLRGDDTALGLLRSGTLLESPKTWEQMKRQ
jgi:adenylate cyclase